MRTAARPPGRPAGPSDAPSRPEADGAGGGAFALRRGSRTGPARKRESDSGLVALLKRVRARLGLDEHLLMERFAVTTGVFAVTLVGIVSAAAVIAARDHADQLSSQSVYTTAFRTSRSGLDGRVTGLVRSADGTRAVVLMSLPAGMASMSTDARTYQAFVSGGTLRGTVAPTQQRAGGQVVVYGTSGGLALVLDSLATDPTTGAAAPFGAGLLAITMRANLEISDRAGAAPSRAEADSFALHDQWRIFENPGASGASVDPAMTGAGTPFDAAGFYQSYVVAPQVRAVRAEAQATLAAMQVDLARVKEYSARIGTVTYRGMALRPVETPAAIAGDAVSAAADGTLSLATEATVPGGYSFAVRDDDGVAAYGDETPSPAVDDSSWQSSAVWQFTDGTTLDSLVSDPLAADAVTAVSALRSAWSTYYSDKQSYQKTVLGKLVALSRATEAVGNATTANAADGTVRTY